MRGLKSIATAAMALVIGAAPMVGTAEAGHRHHHRHHNHGDAAVAGIIGFGVGTLFGSALSAPRYYAPPPRAYYRPAPVIVHQGLVPWTGEWYAYCDAKYRSFNPRTGYFLGYDGEYHFCR